MKVDRLLIEKERLDDLDLKTATTDKCQVRNGGTYSDTGVGL